MTTTAATPLSRIIPVGEIAWEEGQPGIRAKNLWADAATKRRAVMTRIEPGSMGYRPNGCVHVVSSKNGATVLAILTGGVEPATEIGNTPPSQVFTLSNLPWIDARPGVRQKRIWEDKASERRAILARFEPGATLPPHRHVGDELIFVIEGAVADESGAVITGNMNYRPNGCVHTVTTGNGATVLAVVWGRTEPV
jgi:quercetin dioxygenase-like cupin family protein